MKKLIAAAILAFAALSIGQSAFAGYNCTTRCDAFACYTNCY